MARGGFGDIKGAMHRRAQRLEPALKGAVEKATRLIWKVSHEKMNELIYGNPPDTNKASYRSKSGRKVKLTEAWRKRAKAQGRRGGKGFQWTQTGNLLRSEKKRVRGLEGFIINDAKAKKGGTGYAQARHNLGLSPGDQNIIPPPPKRKRKTTRQAPFRAIAIRETEAERRAIFRGAVHRVLDSE